MYYNNSTGCSRICVKRGPRGPEGPQGPRGPEGPDSYNDYTISSILTNPTYTLYTDISDFDFYQVDTTNNEITIVLPLISSLTNNKRIHTFSDVGGNLTTNSLKIQTSGTDIIAGTNELLANINYSSITVVSNTNGIWIVS